MKLMHLGFGGLKNLATEVRPNVWQPALSGTINRRQPPKLAIKWDPTGRTAKNRPAFANIGKIRTFFAVDDIGLEGY